MGRGNRGVTAFGAIFGVGANVGIDIGARVAATVGIGLTGMGDGLRRSSAIVVNAPLSRVRSSPGPSSTRTSSS